MDGKSREQLYDELDTSLEFGAGVLCLAGPPGSGKTTLLLDYLAAREDNFAADAGVVHACARSGVPVLHTEYMTARSLSTGVWTYLAHRILSHLRTQHEQRLRRQLRHSRADENCSEVRNVTSASAQQRGHQRDRQGRPRRRPRGVVGGEYSALEFGHVVLQWLEGQPNGSELHLVVDDADTLFEGEGVGAESLDLWLSGGCLTTLSTAPQAMSRVYLWVISQLPLQLRHCFRYHAIAPPSTAVLLDWLDELYAEHGNGADESGAMVDEGWHSVRRRPRPDCLCASTPVQRARHEAHEDEEYESDEDDAAETTDRGNATHEDDKENADVVCGPPPCSRATRDGLLESPAHNWQRRVSRHQAHAWVRQGLEYYTTHHPMCASLASRDIRQLLLRIDTVLPALIMTRTAPSRGGAGGGQTVVEAVCEGAAAATPVNAIQLAAAWGMYTELRSAQDGGAGAGGTAAIGGGEACVEGSASSSLSVFARGGAAGGRFVDPLVQALKQLGHSAVLLAFVAFYCGAVPPSKQYQALAPHHHVHRGGLRRSRASKKMHETSAQSHRATVLSASAHVITVAQLLFVYAAVRDVCAATVDTRELVSAEMAMHYVSTLVSWGLLTPVLTQQTRSYHCWIAVSTAQLLGRALGINIFDLIPN